MSRLSKVPLSLVTTVFLLIAIAGCSPAVQNQPYDTNTEISAGEPAFPSLRDSWVIDNAGVLTPETIHEADAICQKLQDDGIAEVVVLVIGGVKHPEIYATHYGRWLKLGKKGLSGEGGNNGLVWLIRPDAELKLTISVGRGLPKFTAVDYGQIMDKAEEHLNFQNYDRGALLLVKETDRTLRKIYEKERR